MPIDRQKQRAAWLNELAAQFAARRCAECGRGDVVAIRPGTDELHTEHGNILVQRGEASTAWCLACLLRRGQLQEAAR